MLKAKLALAKFAASTSRWRVANTTASGGIDAGSWNRGFDFPSELCIRLVRLVAGQVPPVKSPVRLLSSHFEVVNVMNIMILRLICPMMLWALGVHRQTLLLQTDDVMQGH